MVTLLELQFEIQVRISAQFLSKLFCQSNSVSLISSSSLVFTRWAVRIDLAILASSPLMIIVLNTRERKGLRLKLVEIDKLF